MGIQIDFDVSRLDFENEMVVLFWTDSFFSLGESDAQLNSKVGVWETVVKTDCFYVATYWVAP